MLVLGVDAHKRTHTIVAIDERGRQMGGDDQRHHRGPPCLGPGPTHGEDRLWAVEDCRHLSRRLERDLLGRRRALVRVPPKLMAEARKSSRDYGKSDPSTPSRSPAPPCESPTCPPPTSTDRPASCASWSTTEKTSSRSAPSSTGCAGISTSSTRPGTRPPVARPDQDHRPADRQPLRAGRHRRPPGPRTARAPHRPHRRDQALDAEIGELVTSWRPPARDLRVGTLSAAKIVGETADVRRFKSKDAFARYNGTAPLPVWSRTTPASPSRVGTANSTAPSTAWRSPSPLAPRRPGLPRTPQSRRRHPERSPTSPQAPPLRRRLPSPVADAEQAASTTPTEIVGQAA